MYLGLLCPFFVTHFLKLLAAFVLNIRIALRLKSCNRLRGKLISYSDAISNLLKTYGRDELMAIKLTDMSSLTKPTNKGPAE